MHVKWILGWVIAAVGGIACSQPTQKLAEQEIHPVILKQQKTIGDCYRPRKDGASGELLFTFTIEPNGDMSELYLAKDTLHEPKVAQCLLKIFHALRFPANPRGAPTPVSYPIVFKADQNEGG